MSILNIIQLNKEDFYRKDVLLRQKSIEVLDFGEQFQKEVDDLIETFRHWKIAVGLSAVQVGILKKFSIINLNKGKPEDGLIIVNPVILSESGKKDIKKESCLSLPKVRGEVERRNKLHLKYQDRFGRSHTTSMEGFKARVVFHEVDHMDGVLYIDKMKAGKVLEPLEIDWE